MNMFWDESENYFTNPQPVTDTMIKKTEDLLGYKLPKSYMDLIKIRNGGTPINTCFPTASPTSWAEDHIAISSINGIGGEWGIDTDSGSQFMIQEWGYPDIGIVLCSTPSGGHDAVMLDYSKCGNNGEPRVIHVDVEDFENPNITFLAENFDAFISGLVNEDLFNDE
ncbi:SMI1/KNR4 family protein [Peribacillus deserti]|nr:SMI1/KNR4 family protein [Peribacillus deserti]